MRKAFITLAILLLVCSHVRAAETWLPNTTDGTLRPVSKPGGGYYSIRLPDSDSSHFITPLFGNITAARTFTVELNDASRTLTFTGNATVGGTNTGDQTIALTGDVTGSGTGSFAATIANDVIDFADMADSMTLDANLAWASPGNFSVNIDSNTLFVDTLNNSVGIGTATPNRGGWTRALTVAASDRPAIELFGNRGGSNGATGDIVFLNDSHLSSDERIATITARRYGADSDGALGFWVYGGSLQERLTILPYIGSAPGVGIDDPSPDASLDITNDGVGDSFIVADTNDGDATPFVVQSDGDVGIGVSTFSGDGGVSPKLAIGNPSDSTEWVGLGYDHTGDYGFIYAVDNAVGWKPLVVVGSPVGIGDTSPQWGIEVGPVAGPNATMGVNTPVASTGSYSAVFVASQDSARYFQLSSSGSTVGGSRFGVSLAGANELLSVGSSNFMIGTLSASQNLILGTNSAERVRIMDAGLGIGQTSFGTSATKTLAIGSGTAPSTSPADAFQMYSADISPGMAAPHFLTEDTKVIKLYQQAANADTTGAALADLETEVNQLKALLRNSGQLAP